MARTRSFEGGVRRALVRCSAVSALLIWAFAMSAVPASAGELAGSSPYPHPERNYMGSTIPGNTGQEKGRSLSWQQARDVSPQATVPGIDVSHWQGNIDWNAVEASGIEFAYMKATEGTYYTDPSFDSNYIGSYNQGMIRGAYHFANPADSSGAAQARFFVNNGGGWSDDGQTLPPLLDMEYNPYEGNDCYNLSDGQMVNWIADFSNTVKNLTGRYPAIYTTTNWWVTCTGNYAGFADTNPLMIANWGADAYPLPAGWGFYTIWQYTSTGSVSGIAGNVDRDVFNGNYDRLVAFATCTNENPC